MYELDPGRIDLAEEFKARPYGEHSPDLQYLLNLMRKPRAEPFHVLVMTAAGERWTLALMAPGAKRPAAADQHRVHQPRGGRVARVQAALAGAERPGAADRLSQGARGAPAAGWRSRRS